MFVLLYLVFFLLIPNKPDHADDERLIENTSLFRKGSEELRQKFCFLCLAMTFFTISLFVVILMHSTSPGWHYTSTIASSLFIVGFLSFTGLVIWNAFSPFMQNMRRILWVVALCFLLRIASLGYAIQSGCQFNFDCKDVVNWISAGYYLIGEIVPCSLLYWQYVEIVKAMPEDEVTNPRGVQ